MSIQKQNLALKEVVENLTPKQHGFVKDYLETGNASLAVKSNYNVKNDATARSIGRENLTKPNIRAVIVKQLADTGIGEKEMQLLTSTLKRNIAQTKDLSASNRAIDITLKLVGAYPPEKHAPLKK